MTRSAREARDPAGVVAFTQYSSASSPNTSFTNSTYVSPSFDIEYLSLSVNSRDPLYLHRSEHQTFCLNWCHQTVLNVKGRSQEFAKAGETGVRGRKFSSVARGRAPLRSGKKPPESGNKYGGWSAWLSDRTSVSGQRSFAILRSTCSWWVTTYVGKPSAICQPTRPTQPFILSGSINEQWAAIRCPPPHSVKAPSGERLRSKGWHGVLCRLKAVWSMSERFKVVCIPCKALYTSALLYFLPYTETQLKIQNTPILKSTQWKITRKKIYIW